MGSMGSIRTQEPPNIYNTTAAIYYAVSGHWTLVGVSGSEIVEWRGAEFWLL